MEVCLIKRHPLHPSRFVDPTPKYCYIAIAIGDGAYFDLIAKANAIPAAVLEVYSKEVRIEIF